MKKVLISFDSFKDCIGSFQLGTIVDQCLKEFYDENKIANIEGNEILRISDGGEGLLECLQYSLNLDIKQFNADDGIIGPLGTVLESCRYAYHREENYAVIEMAEASGIQLVPVKKRTPFLTTTYGTGQLILDAIKSGFKKIYIGAGGSATNDAGLGALQALKTINVKINHDEHYYKPILFGKDITNITSIDVNQEFVYSDIEFYFLSDVKNPMVGPNGAVYSFAGQKGASENDKIILEQGMVNVSKLYPIDISTIEGTGAAGGLASGFMSIFNQHCKIINGMSFVCNSYHLEERLENGEFSLMITGEGCFDDTTLSGKVVSRMMSICQQHNIPLLIICGMKSISNPNYQTFNPETCKIFDLVSQFGSNESLNNTKHCINQLFVKNQNLINFLKKIL
ncbi:hypothetical protein DICPUDRAFT_41765 [Dictyostelium purpureum]|uniref:Glycerate kinase n=1 Tax=Dictyostelium purpureum TaxID=5786 RepID=F1A0R0_DICPU|nr:uncharacterized protein DICPUDRAFT_41765 [Dictyostelium purpureum]EGC30221.1 hypothetical protein DICPUDRAFT_41765 [Dictyostelium purpureum]|eukprot:XP_003293257.1 hypothetical protein DICPUDRAFT_41765 [Dictyostelium purpureum]